MNRRPFYLQHISIALLVTLGVLLPLLTADARSTANPWSPESGFQNLVYKSSSSVDVMNILGPPDEIIRREQMFPVIENFLYYEDEKREAASVLVFENGLLAGLHYKSPRGQMVDFTYFLLNNSDRLLNAPLQEGYYQYYPGFPFTTLY